MPRLLVIGSVWPEPRSSAAGAHLLQIMTPFRERGWEITFASTASDSLSAADLPALGIRSVQIQVNDEGFDAQLESIRPDVVVFDRFFVEEQFGWRVEEQCPDALRVLNSEDLHSLRDARARRVQSGTNFEPTANHGGVLLREIASILRSDLTLVISEHEMHVLQNDFRVDAELLHYCPFMLDPPTPAEKGTLPSFEERRNFVCVGNYRHAPNWDAIRWLAREIWPLIRKRLPEAELHIAGAYATSEQLALNAPERGLFVEGRIDDADAHFRQSRICLAPLRFGAGLKGKIFDAMRNGTPSVTTSVGAEAIAGDLPFGGSVEENPVAIAEAAVRLYEDATHWTQAQSNGFAILERRFDRRIHQAALLERIQDARTSVIEARQRNITGAVLRDQSHRSTRYLSRWIEAKNELAEIRNESSDRRRAPHLKKLLQSKWSAVAPRDREKHFVVTRVIESKPPATGGPRVELEALLSKRRYEILIEELSDATAWTQGWV